MKTLMTVLAIAAAATLSGCAYDTPRGAYGTAYAPPPADASQWHVVSVTPVAPGTGDRLAATSGKGTATEYSSTPITAPSPWVTQPVYVQQPVYYPAPVYYAPAPYYYPPVSIDLGFGRSWGGRHGGRNWGGIGIGTRLGGW